METINITRKSFESLQKYYLPNFVFNTEGNLYILPIKDKWEIQMKLLKSLYFTNGAVFGNKLQTINSLIDNKEIIDIPEIVFPEKIAIVDSQIVGFTMPLIESINLKEALISQDISNDMKIQYLKQVGLILEKMKMVRTHTTVDDFFINDLHESNFIVDTDNCVRVIDIDSCKITGNHVFNSKYLSFNSFISEISKYQKNKNVSFNEGYIIPDENSEIYCYIIMILNFLYGDKTENFTLGEFYDYLEYLEKIGVEKELIFVFEKIASNSPNVNPYELLDSLTKYIGQSNHHVYSYIKKKLS